MQMRKKKRRFVFFISFYVDLLVCFGIVISNFGSRMGDKKTENGTKCQNNSVLPEMNWWTHFLFFFCFFEALVWTVRPGHSSQTQMVRPRFTRFIEFLCRAGFESKRTILMDSSRLTRSNRMVRSEFQNHIFTNILLPLHR